MNDVGQQPYTVIVHGQLPYYVPFPNGFAFTTTLSEDEPCKVSIIPLYAKDNGAGGQSQNIDDRMGTFYRSLVICEFASREGPEIPDAQILGKVLKLTNSLIDSIRYHTSDISFRPILQFSHHRILYYQNGVNEIPGSEGMSFGPFGMNIKQIYSLERVREILEYFNGAKAINPAYLLVLDAEYHNLLGDINRAILDLGTALEIHVEWLIEQYKPLVSGIGDINTDGKALWDLYDGVLIDAIGHSLREREDLFIRLEYIRGIRNSVTHEWKPVFRITDRFRSQYMDHHRKNDGREIRTRIEVTELIRATRDILQYVEELFPKRKE